MFQMSGVTNAAQKGGGCFPAFQCDTVTSKTYYCFLSSKRIVRTQSFRLGVSLFISKKSYRSRCFSLKELSTVRAKKDVSYLRLCGSETACEKLRCWILIPPNQTRGSFIGKTPPGQEVESYFSF